MPPVLDQARLSLIGCENGTLAKRTTAEGCSTKFVPVSHPVQAKIPPGVGQALSLISCELGADAADLPLVLPRDPERHAKNRPHAALQFAKSVADEVGAGLQPQIPLHQPICVGEERGRPVAELS